MDKIYETQQKKYLNGQNFPTSYVDRQKTKYNEKVGVGAAKEQEE